MRRLLVDSSKRVANPNPSEVAAGKRTVFDTWAAAYPDANHPGEPRYRPLNDVRLNAIKLTSLNSESELWEVEAITPRSATSSVFRLWMFVTCTVR